MNIKLETLALAACMALGGTAFAAAPKAKPQPMTKAQYQAEQNRIEAQYKTDRKFCDSLQGAKEKVCEAEAKGRQAALQAELDAKYKPGPEASQKAKNITADANFDVAKAKCDTLKGKPKDRCVNDAKAAREAAVRQAKVEKVRETGGPFAAGSAHRVVKGNDS